MIVAKWNGSRIEAEYAQKGEEFLCPGCHGTVILKQGRKVVAHFAHKPPTNCIWAKGETRQHLESKSILADAFRERGLRAEVEFQVKTLSGDRRADVMTWGPNGQPVAVELQHTSIALDELQRRAFSYANAGIAQIWIPFIRSKVWSDAIPQEASRWKVEKYSAKPFEIWINGVRHGTGMWMYDPRERQFWRGSLSDSFLWKEESIYFDEYGEENYSPGGWYKSKRWKKLILEGPYRVSALRLVVMKPWKAFATTYPPYYRWPEGRFVDLKPV